MSRDLDTSFFGMRYILRISMSNLYIEIIGSRLRSQEQNGIYEHNYIHTVAGDQLSIERQSCFGIVLTIFLF